MVEFTIGAIKYRTRPLDAFKQFHVSRRLIPVLGELAKLFTPRDGALPMVGKDDLPSAIVTVGGAISQMSDADSEYVLRTCMSVCDREIAGGVGWGAVINPAGALMYEDIGMAGMMQIAFQVIQENLASFFAALPSSSAGSEAEPGTLTS